MRNIWTKLKSFSQGWKTNESPVCVFVRLFCPSWKFRCNLWYLFPLRKCCFCDNFGNICHALSRSLCNKPQCTAIHCCAASDTCLDSDLRKKTWHAWQCARKMWSAMCGMCNVQSAMCRMRSATNQCSVIYCAAVVLQHRHKLLNWYIFELPNLCHCLSFFPSHKFKSIATAIQ